MPKANLKCRSNKNEKSPTTWFVFNKFNRNGCWFENRPSVRRNWVKGKHRNETETLYFLNHNILLLAIYYIGWFHFGRWRIRNETKSKSITSMKNQRAKECFEVKSNTKKIGCNDLWNYLRNYVNQCIRLKRIYTHF